MAKSEKFVSDVSGLEIPEGKEVALYLDIAGRRHTFHFLPEELVSMPPKVCEWIGNIVSPLVRKQEDAPST